MIFLLQSVTPVFVAKIFFLLEHGGGSRRRRRDKGGDGGNVATMATTCWNGQWRLLQLARPQFLRLARRATTDEEGDDDLMVLDRYVIFAGMELRRR